MQGVHEICEGNYDRAWRPDEQRNSKMVVIGRDLPKDIIRQGFQECSVAFEGETAFETASQMEL